MKNVDFIAELYQIQTREELVIWKKKYEITMDFLMTVVAEIQRLMDSDPDPALRLSEWCVLLADGMADPIARARAQVARAAALVALRQQAKALPYLDEALRMYEEAGDVLYAAKVRMNRVPCYSFVGRYEDAQRDGKLAEEVFTRLGEKRLLAMNHLNLGQVHFRLDQFQENLARLDQAETLSVETNDPRNLVKAYLNRAVTLTSLNVPSEASRYYELAGQLALKMGMRIIVASCNYNVGYLCYLQGQYSRALQILGETRNVLTTDKWHAGLCDLTQGEIYLELNMFREAARLAETALHIFESIERPFDMAKALAVMAIAAGRLGQFDKAARLFERAGTMFQVQGNLVRAAVIDLYRGIVCLRLGQYSQARVLARTAFECFMREDVKPRAAFARIISARASLGLAELDAASSDGREAMFLYEASPTPWVGHQLHGLIGELHLAQNDLKGARAEFCKAIDDLEGVRANILFDELRVNYLKDKGAFYESLVSTDLRSGEPALLREAFETVERAKSRTLVDLLAGNIHQVHSVEKNAVGKKLQDIRAEWEWYQRRITEETEKARGALSSSVRDLMERARHCETRFQDILRDSPADTADYLSLQRVTWSSIENIQQALPPDAALVEYFMIGDDVMLFLATRERFEVIPRICSRSELKERFDLLRFQLSKASIKQASSFLLNIQDHLKDLYGMLIGSIEKYLNDRRSLIVVPYDFLHYLPFHSLFDGNQYLVDRLDISYAPTANIYMLLTSQQTESAGVPLLIGVPDSRTPFITEEIEGIRSVLPGTKALVGPEATREGITREMTQARLIHIASHASFRPDNAMFSSIQLHDTWLNFFDIYSLRTSASLVTLSGCGTGLSNVVGGDELLGLVRGFFYAGAKSVVVSLWDVNDRTTAELMKYFYGFLSRGVSKSESLRRAMLQLKQGYPHPYHWAPFLLMGNPS